MYCAILSKDDEPTRLDNSKFDVSNRNTWPPFRIAWFSGDKVGTEVQCFEFNKTSAEMMNYMADKKAVFFDTADEFIAWRDEFLPPTDENGNPKWERGVINTTINTIKGWFR